MTHNKIKKSKEKSYFLKLHYNSPLADKVLKRNPSYGGENISILQILNIGDGFLLIEIEDL